MSEELKNLKNNTKYLGRKNDGGVVEIDIYKVKSGNITRIVGVKSIQELIKHYDNPKNKE